VLKVISTFFGLNVCEMLFESINIWSVKYSVPTWQCPCAVIEASAMTFDLLGVFYRWFVYGTTCRWLLTALGHVEGFLYERKGKRFTPADRGSPCSKKKCWAAIELWSLFRSAQCELIWFAPSPKLHSANQNVRYVCFHACFLAFIMVLKHSVTDILDEMM